LKAQSRVLHTSKLLNAQINKAEESCFRHKPPHSLQCHPADFSPSNWPKVHHL
jgi:hypothetical protein